MSKVGETQTLLREKKFLVQALKAMGHPVEADPSGVRLKAYYSDQEQKVANIILWC